MRAIKILICILLLGQAFPTQRVVHAQPLPWDSIAGETPTPLESFAAEQFPKIFTGESDCRSRGYAAFPTAKHRYKKLKIIAIDAGHGGEDDGAIAPSNDLKEKTLTLDVCIRIAKLLERSGYRVILTRRRDEKIPLLDRTEIANRSHADLFICIHFNSAPSPGATGIETFILPPSGRVTSAQSSDRSPGNAFDELNMFLGNCLQSSLIGELQSTDRGVKQHKFTVLCNLKCPGALIECGFLSNADEAAKIASAAYRDRLAQAIVAGIKKFDGAVSK